MGVQRRMRNAKTIAPARTNAGFIFVNDKTLRQSTFLRRPTWRTTDLMQPRHGDDPNATGTKATPSWGFKTIGIAFTGIERKLSPQPPPWPIGPA